MVSSKFLTEHILDWSAPTAEKEVENPLSTRAAYESAIRWLKEQTRNREDFHLVYKENVAYGFRRNLYGLKEVGLSIAVTCAIGNAWTLYAENLANLEISRSEGFFSLILSLSFVAVWAFFVRPSWVREAADSYAKAILAACDRLDSGAINLKD